MIYSSINVLLNTDKSKGNTFYTEKYIRLKGWEAPPPPQHCFANTVPRQSHPLEANEAITLVTKRSIYYYSNDTTVINLFSSMDNRAQNGKQYKF